MNTSSPRPSLRTHPHLYEIPTWVWLGELSRKYGRLIRLGNVPDQEWDTLAAKGFDCIWLMGMWQRSQASRSIATADAELRKDYDRTLPDWKPTDVVGSPYAIHAYRPDSSFGTWADLDHVLDQLHHRGMKLILDFVPNHTGLDHDWVSSHPEFYIQGTARDYENSPSDFLPIERQPHTQYLAHGKDPYFPPWTDTLQLNYAHEPTRQALLQKLQHIAQHCDGVRCDMAMLVLNNVFKNTWAHVLPEYPTPAQEFWAEATHMLPEFIWIAEVYWDLEWELQQLGFDFTYDKRLYDRFRHSPPQDIALHLTADVAYQNRLVRFLENHDEPRSAKTFGIERLPAFVTLAGTLPGMRMYFQGQLEGAKIRTPVQLGRRRDESINQDIMTLYERLLLITNEEVFHNREWRLLSTRPAGNETFQNLIAYQWQSSTAWKIVIVNVSDVLSQGHVELSEVLPSSYRGYCFVDQLTRKRFTYAYGLLAKQGLPILLDPFSAHIFDVSIET
ncbi:alpha-amylase family glycosyl hydrolase [Candidatus Nitronereus thalassa]|uniref:Alpha-amylase family glycosyl hydrolase n=1 Tax=Candidatus Nitronereus thalassa TaxID=3020898 RepID=A0ABU3K7K7_9BACT|nr:alpha-amylase family glycosyl hydrolase [Candidatus Nitronereus thalassa]MDT7042391.1 alpha-amylase family glycosyl hydrolase [Candidatus Nitronereus thalassa]